MTVAVAGPVIVMVTMCIVVMMVRHEIVSHYFIILRFIHTPLIMMRGSPFFS
jgi:hypothetical protein